MCYQHQRGDFLPGQCTINTQHQRGDSLPGQCAINTIEGTTCLVSVPSTPERGLPAWSVCHQHQRGDFLPGQCTINTREGTSCLVSVPSTPNTREGTPCLVSVPSTPERGLPAWSVCHQHQRGDFLPGQCAINTREGTSCLVSVPSTPERGLPAWSVCHQRQNIFSLISFGPRTRGERLLDHFAGRQRGWSALPQDLRHSSTLSSFKTRRTLSSSHSTSAPTNINTHFSHARTRERERDTHTHRVHVQTSVMYHGLNSLHSLFVSCCIF